MKKKLWIVVIAALCLALVGALAACKGKTKIELNKTEITISEGEDERLIATTSDDSDVSWSSSNDSIATVSSRGVVTGQKAGEATITATSGKATATCKVTVKPKVIVNFTFKSEGETIETVELDRNGKETMQLEVAASDGSSVTSWRSSDENTVTVSDTGLVTAVFDGEATLTVRTDSGASGSIKVKVIDTLVGKYLITNQPAGGMWWYFTNTADGRDTTVSRAEFRDDKVTFNFSGNGNWYYTDIQLGLRKSNDTTDGWKKLTAKIETDFDGSILIHNTEVNVKKDQVNDVTVYFDQTDINDQCLIYFSGVNTGKVKISDIAWTTHTVSALTTPSVTYSDGNVTITDSNDASGVKKYVIGLYEDDALRFAQTFTSKEGGKLNVEECEFNGEFTAKVRAMAQPGFTSSGWSTDESNKVTVNNKPISYEMTAGEGDKTAEQAAVADGKWHCWNEYNNITTGTYNAGTVTLTSRDWGGNWYSTQLFKNYSYFDAETNIKITLTINAPVACHITVSGKVIALQAGEHTYDIYTKQSSGGATIGIQFGAQVGGIDIEEPKNEMTFTFSNIAVSEYTPEKLAAPSAIAISDEKIVTITDTNEADRVLKYEAGFFTVESGATPYRTVAVADGEEIDTSKVPTGTYNVKVRAVAKDGTPYITSDWSTTVLESYEVVTVAKEQYDLPNGGNDDNPNAVSDPGIWYEWHDQGWCGSNVTITSAKYDKGTVTITFSATGACAFGLQLMYVNPDYVEGEVYSYDLTSTANVTVKDVPTGTSKNLTADETWNVEGTAANKLHIEVSIVDGLSATITVSNVAWAAPQA